MKVVALILSLLTLSPLLLGASNLDINLFIFNYLGENETFTKTPFNFSGVQYYVVNIINTSGPSFIIQVSQKDQITMLTDKSLIRDSLLAYYASQGISQEDLKLNQSYADELLSRVDSYNESRAEEFACKKYIGIDRFPCVDLETCWRACYTPICQQMKIGAGKPFLEMIWSFSNLSLYIDSNISEFNAKLGSPPECISVQHIDELVALLDNTKNNSIAVNSNDLLNPAALGFCPPVEYNLTALTQAKTSLLRKRESISLITNLDDTTDALYNTTMQRISQKAQFRIDKLCSLLISNNAEEFSSIKANLSTLNTSMMRDKLRELEDAGKLGGCNMMNETQMQSAELSYSNLSQQVRAYAEELAELIKLNNEVGSDLIGMQGDWLLYFKLGEFNSRFNQLSSELDSASFSQLPALETQLLQLKGELEGAKNNRPFLFIYGIATSPFVVILVVLVLAMLILLKFRRKKKSSNKKYS